MKYLENVVTLQLDRDKCVGCGRCLEVCPHGVFSLTGDKTIIVDRDACMECGACARNCPAGALYVKNGVGCAVGAHPASSVPRISAPTADSAVSCTVVQNAASI